MMQLCFKFGSGRVGSWTCDARIAKNPRHRWRARPRPRPRRWKVYPGFPIGLPWVPVFSPVFVRFPHIKRSPVGSRVFSGFHSSSYDPDSCTLGSRRNKRSPWVPCPIEVDGGSWRTGAQEHSAAFPTRTAAARLVSRMSSEASELSDAEQGAISAEESLSCVPCPRYQTLAEQPWGAPTSLDIVVQWFWSPTRIGLCRKGLGSAKRC